MSDDDAALGRLQRARALMDLGRPEQALPLLAEALAEQPGNVDAWCVMARCHYARHDYRDALHAADQALAHKPDQVVAWRFRTLALIELEQWEPAWAAAGESVRHDPHHWYGHMLVAKVLLANTTGYFHSAVAQQAAFRARELAPQEPDTHFILGRVAERSGHRPEAEGCYREALRLDPEHRAARNQLALLQMQRGDHYGAAQGFAAVAAADQSTSGLGVHNLRVVTVRLIAPARWISIACFLLVNVMVQAQGQTDWTARGICLGGVVLAWGGWLLWAVRQVPAQLRRPLLLSARRSRYVGYSLLGVSALTIAALALLSVPALAGVATVVLVAGIIAQALALQAARRSVEQDKAALRG